LLDEAGSVKEGEGEERGYKDQKAEQENNKQTNSRNGQGEGTGNKAIRGHSQGSHEKVNHSLKNASSDSNQARPASTLKSKKKNCEPGGRINWVELGISVHPKCSR
jgi:hypothetical protein